MSSFSRRDFLARSSITLAGASLARAFPAWAAPQTPWRRLPSNARQPVQSFFPDIVSPETLRKLALVAIDAAMQAGATYADIRVADTRRLQVSQEPIEIPVSDMRFDMAFGLRVCVNGAWGTAFGADPTTDTIAEAARRAAHTAAGVAKVVNPMLPLPALPVARGEWETPVQIDPFSVSPNAHAEVVGAYKEIAERVPMAFMDVDRLVWIAETRVFASSEGALITQRLSRAAPHVSVNGYGFRSDESVVLPVPGFAPRSAGFELLTGTGVQERIKACAEEAARLATFPEARVDVGRYEAVLDGNATGAILGATVLSALEMDRVLGYTADQGGTSFLAPPDQILGKPLFSPLVHVTADRALPQYGAVRWDDEGTEPHAFPVIRNGRVVDYFTSRVTAPYVADWYAKHGIPLGGHGSAVSWSATAMPSGCASHVEMHPADHGPSLDDMVKQLQTGILILGVREMFGGSGITSDQQFASAWFKPAMVYEVKRGQITRRLTNGAVQLGTKRFWQSLTTVGGASSVQETTHSDTRGEPPVDTVVPISAPAIRLRQLDLTFLERPQ